MDAPPVPPAPAVQKALSCVSYDQYKDHYMDNFLVDDVVDFNTYIENNIMVRMLPCSKQNGTEINLIIPGENARLGQYLLASEEAKLLTHSLLESIWERAQNDECFGLFDESNVLVHSSGKAKFHHVPVLPKTDVLLTQSLLNARRIIRKMIFKQKDSNSDPISIPEDFKHLFDIIKNKTLASFDLFHIHPSLVPLSNEFAMLVLLYEELKNLPDSKLKEVYRKLPYIDTWTQSINQNNLLREKYYFFPGRYDDPLYCSSEQELKEKRGENFSVYMRNSTAHRRDQTPSVNQNHVNALAQQQRRSQQQQQQNIQSHQRQQQQQNIQSHQRQQQQQNIQSHQRQQQQQHKFGWKVKPNTPQINPSDEVEIYATNSFDLVRHVHYPRFLPILQESLFEIHPSHVKRLNLHALF